jgi:hypothetical protein
LRGMKWQVAEEEEEDVAKMEVQQKEKPWK